MESERWHHVQVQDGGEQPDCIWHRGARISYLAEFYTPDGGYLGAIGQDGDDYEHFECAVSPTGLYQPHELGGNPCDEEGKQIQGELWVFKQSKQLTRVITSFKKGGSKAGRMPVQKWQ